MERLSKKDIYTSKYQKKPMKPKIVLTKQQQINYWIEQYLQSKASGDRNKMKIFEAIIIKLGGKIPRL